MMTRVVGEGFVNPIAAVEAISKFEGPANGIRFNPKANAKIST
jgi:hypothetical protein